MPPFGSGIAPFVPFPNSLPIPESGLYDDHLCSITINREWMSYLASTAATLVADSTWSAGTKDELTAVTGLARQLVEYLAQPDDPVSSIEFQKKPGQLVDWQYRLGGGAWIDGPLCAVEFTPNFISSSAPGGYDLSVNGDLSQTPIPLLTANDPNAVVTDPISDLVNTVAPGLDISALKLIAQGDADVLTIAGQAIAIGNLLTFVAVL